MGKAADNEKRKLEAAFCNNIAVGLFIGGVFLPLLTFVPKAASFGPWFNNWLGGTASLNIGELFNVVLIFFAMALAFWCGYRLHSGALKIAAKIKD